ncbi:MAG TPA: deoxyguanosinetriphosphate triphosphohydrolase [Planctomycetota bacterium]|nr:deoxyguanosinetriphosphate triphosphohydrolase [Planctomycetota bacterium]
MGASMKDQLLTVEGMHRREAELLAPYAMKSGDSRGRQCPEPEPRYRTSFQRDRDRIVHSTAFRRLEYKTQVFVNHEGDHYRTRLTHTLEVAQISRSIARVLRLNEDLVEAIALSHDLGHSPFGHAGEEILNVLMKDRGGFNHNRQSLRVVDVLEKRYPEFDGLNLSFEIRESIAKHGDCVPPDLDPCFERDLKPLLEAQLADIADSLAYDTHDIDDGLRSGFLLLEDLRRVRLWGEAEKSVVGSHPHMESKTLVARTVSRLIDMQVTDLIETTCGRLTENRITTVEGVRAHPTKLVGFSSEMTRLAEEMHQFLTENLYHHYRTLKMAEKAKRFVAEIFEEYVRNPRQLPPAFQERIPADGIERAICDYIAGMTDRFCQDEYKRLFYPFERV